MVCPQGTASRPKTRFNVIARLKARMRNEDGGATIETVMWMPFFAALFTLIVDGTLIFHNHSNVLRVVQDANRALSVGRFDTVAEAQTAIQTNAAHLSSNINVETTVTGGIINTTVRVPAADLDMTGLFTGISNATLTINAQHYMEL